jgi:hypothetical protein
MMQTDSRRLRNMCLLYQICHAHVNRNVRSVSRYLRHDLVAAIGTNALEHHEHIGHIIDEFLRTP